MTFKRVFELPLAILQVPPFRKLRQEKTKGRKAKLTEMVYYDWQQMRTAFTGSLPMIGEANPYAGKVLLYFQADLFSSIMQDVFKVVCYEVEHCGSLSFKKPSSPE